MFTEFTDATNVNHADGMPTPVRPYRAEALSDDKCLSDVCLSVAYIGLNSRTDRAPPLSSL